MQLIETGLEGLMLLQNPVHRDERGLFFKPFEWKDIPIGPEGFISKEIYYSVNHAHVIRGMHFQNPPNDHAKLVWVSQGRILDVVLDIRKGSGTYGNFYSRILSRDEGLCILIPKGFAHGFLSMEDSSIVNYSQTSEYDKNSDSGILYDSFGFDWPEKHPIVSTRDQGFTSFSHFSTEFV